MRHRLPKSNRGFTLVEMLIVVAIISITTAVAIPAVSSYTERMRMQELDTVAREIFAAAQNRATTMKATGELDAFADEMGTSKTYFVWNEDEADYFAPQLTATARDGEYLVEIDTTTGQVQSVFFKDFVAGESPIDDTVATDWLDNYKADPTARAENLIGFYDPNVGAGGGGTPGGGGGGDGDGDDGGDVPDPVDPSEQLKPKISVEYGTKLVLTLTCSQIDTPEEFDITTATLTLKNESRSCDDLVFETEEGELVQELIYDMGTGKYTYQIILTLDDGADIKFTETYPDFQEGNRVLAIFDVYCGVRHGDDTERFKIKTESGLLPPVSTWDMTDYNDPDLTDTVYAERWTEGDHPELLYFVYFEQYMDASFGYQLISDAPGVTYPSLDNDKDIHTTGYGVMAPGGAPLGGLVVAYGEGSSELSPSSNSNMLYETGKSAKFGGDTLYLHAFNTKKGRIIGGVMTDDKTKDGIRAEPFLWADAVAFKYDTAGSPGQKYYANFNFAPSPTPTDDIGEGANPLTVRTMEHMRNLEDLLVDKYAKEIIDGVAYACVTVTRDLDAEGVPLYDDGGGRYLSTLKPHIILDGGGHTITNTVATLFGNMKGTVKNLNVSGAKFTMRSDYTGIFVEDINGNAVVENCTVKDSKISIDTDDFMAGAFVGKNNGSVIECTATNVTLIDTRDSTSTLLGTFYSKNNGTITDCFVRNDLNAVIWSSNP